MSTGTVDVPDTVLIGSQFLVSIAYCMYVRKKKLTRCESSAAADSTSNTKGNEECRWPWFGSSLIAFTIWSELAKSTVVHGNKRILLFGFPNRMPPADRNEPQNENTAFSGLLFTHGSDLLPITIAKGFFGSLLSSSTILQNQ